MSPGWYPLEQGEVPGKPSFFSLEVLLGSAQGHLASPWAVWDEALVKVGKRKNFEDFLFMGVLLEVMDGRAGRL